MRHTHTFAHAHTHTRKHTSIKYDTIDMGRFRRKQYDTPKLKRVVVSRGIDCRKKERGLHENGSLYLVIFTVLYIVAINERIPNKRYHTHVQHVLSSFRYKRVVVETGYCTAAFVIRDIVYYHGKYLSHHREQSMMHA